MKMQETCMNLWNVIQATGEQPGPCPQPKFLTTKVPWYIGNVQVLKTGLNSLNFALTPSLVHPRANIININTTDQRAADLLYRWPTFSLEYVSYLCLWLTHTEVYCYHIRHGSYFSWVSFGLSGISSIDKSIFKNF